MIMSFIIHGAAMGDPLWAGVALKAQHAEFFLERMGSSLQPPERTAMNVALQSANTIIDTRWQRSFYAYLDAFLVTARSIPEIVQCCFGEDQSKAMAAWFTGLDEAEQTRRRAFSSQFEPDYRGFRQHPLSNARNISFHRAGYASVEVKITGRFGVEHTGSPVRPVPIVESRHLGNIGNDPALQWAV
jgi:hypothetical protein